MSAARKPPVPTVPISKWPLPAAIPQVCSGVRTPGGALVMLSVRFAPWEQAGFFEMLDGILSARQYRPEDLRFVHDERWKGIAIARTKASNTRPVRSFKDGTETQHGGQLGKKGSALARRPEEGWPRIRKSRAKPAL